MKIETNEFITSIKREKKISITSFSKNKIENIVVQLRTSQKQQNKDVTIDIDAKKTKKNVKQYSSHSKSKLKRERLTRMIEDEKTIMRTRNASKAIRYYVIFKLKISSKYRNMTKKKKKQSVKEILKNINAKRFRDEIFDKLTKIFHRFFSQSN
jgi:aspartate oxidase